MNKIEGTLIIIPKHKFPSNGKKRPYRRAFHEDNQQELESMTELAKKYAQENKSGYMIVKVICVVDEEKEEGTENEKAKSN